jgi:FHS family glucose/mannose:H+ symporter-like MFS transporter
LPRPSADASAIRRGHQAIVLACAGLFVFGLIDSVRGPIFPDLLAEFRLSDAEGGLFFFLASAASLVNNVALFSWIERIGARRTVLVYALLQAAGLWVTGLGRGYGWALFGSVLIGLSTGGISIAANVLVAEGARPDLRRRWLAGLHAMYGASALFGPVWVTFCYRLGWGWRWTAASLGLGSLAVCLLALSTDRTLRSRTTHDVATWTPAAAPNRPVRAGAYYGLLCMCYVVAEVTISSRLPLYARREAGYSIANANTLLALFYLGLFVGRVTFAVARVPWRSSTVLAVSAGTGLLCCILGLTGDAAWLAAAGLCFSVFYPAAMALIGDTHGADGSMLYVTSWCITLQAVGLMAMHLGVGYVSDVSGLGRALWVGPTALASTLVLLAVRARATA